MPIRFRTTLRGAVQGVGFLPLIFRLATELGLAGWVLNSSAGLEIEVEGSEKNVHEFLARLETEKPPAAVVITKGFSQLAPIGEAPSRYGTATPQSRRWRGYSRIRRAARTAFPN